MAGAKVQPPGGPERISTPLAESVSPPERSAEPEKPDTPLEMVNPSLLMTGVKVELTPRPLITRCDKSTQTDSPTLHLKRLELGRRLMERKLECNNNFASRRIPLNRLFHKTLFCWCPTIILFLNWVVMDSSLNQ
ncbi:hypothetical protein TNCT_419551 [Trichonephila clavata]|uniref:Uncharacterized protein n=1 Tax=Trichonephila clavata TaxID=2740835 RepID=A0A8X6KK50_TRICU|nr:hypothetical protein TNCT_419551 [Trichonephila clavata]